MDLGKDKAVLRTAYRLMIIGLIVFMIGFTMNKFSFSGFETENREWYQIMVWG